MSKSKDKILSIITNVILIAALTLLKSTFSFLHKQRLPPNKYQDGSLCDYS